MKFPHQDELSQSGIQNLDFGKMHELVILLSIFL